MGWLEVTWFKSHRKNEERHACDEKKDSEPIENDMQVVPQDLAGTRTLFGLSQPDVVNCSGRHVEANSKDQSQRRSGHFLNGSATHEAQTRS